MTKLRDVTCHMGSHSVTCYPTQVNALRRNPSPHAGSRFSDLLDDADDDDDNEDERICFNVA